MVDFQSRDTNRGVSTEDEDEADAEPDEGDETPARESPEETDGNSEVDSDSTGASGGTTGKEGAVGNSGETSDDSGAAVASGGEATGSDPLQPTDASDYENTRSSDDGHSDHDGHSHHHGVNVDELGVAVVTVSSSRTRDDDPSGDTIERLMTEADHEVVTRDLIVDDLDGIQRAVLALTGRDDVDVVVTTGGTGVTPDDVTIEATKPLFDKELPGFGELFRILSYEEVGTHALGTRTTAGISEGVPVFCLPGSEDAVRLGTEELILEEMSHLVGLARRES